MSQDFELHLCDTDSENTSLLINNSNISLLFSPDTFIVTFAWALRQALAYLVRSCHVAVVTMVTKTHNLHRFLNIRFKNK